MGGRDAGLLPGNAGTAVLLAAVLQAAGGELVQTARSIEWKVSAVRRAVWARRSLGGDLAQNDWEPVDVFDTEVIVRAGLKMYRVPFTISDAGDVTFGTAEQVETEYVPVTIEQPTVQAATLLAAEGGKPDGSAWQVVIMEVGPSTAAVQLADGRRMPVYVTEEYLKSLAPLVDGADVFALDDTATGHKPDRSQKLQAQRAGWVDGVTIEPGRLRGKVHLLPTGIGGAKRQELLFAYEKKKRDFWGLSIDADGRGEVRKHGGIDYYFALEASKCDSLDIVKRAGAGGRFVDLAASAADTHHEENSGMNPDQLKRLWAAIQASRPQVLQGRTLDTMEGAQLLQLANAEEIATAFREPPAADAGTEEVRVLATEIRLERALGESKLPAAALKRIREVTKGRVLDDAQIQAAIDGERSYLAQLTPTPVQGLGIGRSGVSASVQVEPLDRLQAGFDRSFGLVPENSELKTIRPLSIRGLYEHITQGLDPNVDGTLQASEWATIQAAGFDSTTLPTVVSNTMNRSLAREYAAVDYGESRFVRIRPGGVRDFRKVTVIRLGGFGDIPNVNPETADYQDISVYGEDPVEYQVGQKGGLVTITRKHIINDDVGHVSRLTNRLGRAAKRTYARFCWNLILSNPVTAYDGLTLFHAAHGNLITDPFSAAALNKMEQNLFKQQEADSQEALALRPHLLAVPIELKPAATNLNKKGTSDSDNEWQGRFGANGENILVPPFLTDATDYYVFGDPAEVDIIEVAFLNDQQEPEYFMADNPTAGQMLVADKLVWKIRHEYGGNVLDHRGVQKAAVI